MKPPAFQFYAAEYLADEHVQLMTLEEEGAYIRLLAFCWREGSIPSDLEALSRLCKGASTTVLSKVVPRFNRSVENGSRLVHARLETERKKQQEWREKSAQGGKASAHKRKHPKQITTEQGGDTKGQPDRLNQTPTLQSSSSSAFASSNGKETAHAEKPRSPRQPKLCDEEWLNSLQSREIYSLLDVRAIHSKMVVWCENKGKVPTRGRLLNWLNSEDKPIGYVRPVDPARSSNHDPTPRPLPPPPPVSDDEFARLGIKQ